MKTIARSPVYLTDKQRKAAIDDIINYFVTERDEELGVIAAEEHLDAFLELVGTQIYNKAIQDCQTFVEQSLVNLPTDMELQLKK